MKHTLGALLMLFILSLSAQDGGLKRPDIPGELMVDVGFNLWSEMPEALERSIWPSKSIAISYTKRRAFSKKLSLNYGIGLSFEKMSLGDSSTLVSNFQTDSANSVLQSVAILPNGQNFDKNKLALMFVDIPIEFRFHPFGTQDGEGLFVGAGGVVGFRLKSHIKQRYENNGETTRQQITGRYNLNNFRYGYQARIGFRGVHLFYKSYLSNTFQDSFGDGSNPTMTTIGINITGF